MKPDKFASRLRDCYQLAGGVVAMSEKTGIPVRTLKSYVNDGVEPKISNITAMGSAAGVSFDWLIAGTQTTPFQAHEYLSPSDWADFLTAAAAGSPGHFSFCLGQVAKSAGVADLAEKIKFSRTSLYKSLSENGDMKISTLFAILKALDLSLEFRGDQK